MTNWAWRPKPSDLYHKKRPKKVKKKRVFHNSHERKKRFEEAEQEQLRAISRARNKLPWRTWKPGDSNWVPPWEEDIPQGERDIFLEVLNKTSATR